MIPLRVRQRAREQTRAIALYLERERPGHGSLFVDAVTNALRLIEQMPEAFAPVPERTRVRRSVLASPFAKFVIYFHAAEGATVVLAIVHSARHPDTWTR